MAGKRADDFSGLSIDDWNIGEYLGKNKYACTCSKCGFKREILGYYIKKNQVPKCTSCTAKQRDISGTNRGDWYVIKKVSSGRQAKYLCRCSCGLEREVLEQSLLNGKSTGCGHATNKKFIDMAGKTIGEWDVLEYNTKTLKWKCRCSCGTERELTGYQLRNKLSLSCGHGTTGLKDLTDQTFGEWTVVGMSDRKCGTNTMWVCVCSCGFIQEVSSYALRSGTSKSCGCKANENRRETIRSLYGVNASSQIGTNRTQEQLEMVESKDNLINAIKKYFKQKPTTLQLAELVGLDRASMMIYIHKYNIERLVDIGFLPVSNYERELRRLFPSDIYSDRRVLDGKELDLLYTDKRLAIEFNGNYWHSELKKPNNYHQNKTLACKDKGIRLIHIFEYEWIDADKKSKIINLIKDILYSENIRSYQARKCEVKEIPADEADKFIEANHIQGKSTAKVNIGLHADGELIGVMTFGKPRFNRNYEWELVRFTWLSGVRVVGGAEKLFKYFIKMYKPTTVISYCDISKFTGDVYERLGFTFNGITEPNYRWVDKENRVIPRYKTMKSNLVKKGLGNESETEVEIMYRLGYIRVFDCGNARYIWNSED